MAAWRFAAWCALQAPSSDRDIMGFKLHSHICNKMMIIRLHAVTVGHMHCRLKGADRTDSGTMAPKLPMVIVFPKRSAGPRPVFEGRSTKSPPSDLDFETTSEPDAEAMEAAATATTSEPGPIAAAETTSAPNGVDADQTAALAEAAHGDANADQPEVCPTLPLSFEERLQKLIQEYQSEEPEAPPG